MSPRTTWARGYFTYEVYYATTEAEEPPRQDRVKPVPVPFSLSLSLPPPFRCAEVKEKRVHVQSNRGPKSQLRRIHARSIRCARYRYPYAGSRRTELPFRANLGAGYPSAVTRTALLCTAVVAAAAAAATQRGLWFAAEGRRVQSAAACRPGVGLVCFALLCLLDRSELTVPSPLFPRGTSRDAAAVSRCQEKGETDAQVRGVCILPGKKGWVNYRSEPGPRCIRPKTRVRGVQPFATEGRVCYCWARSSLLSLVLGIVPGLAQYYHR
ncbi:hypothetical protein LZ32DRAFT_305165 [Colletotrichum eremochloae]|nr:hypothetical protein LZ32DRAFT_305165 [Colletotrichum eremochloae]